MSSSAKRVSRHREALRAQGLKPVQIWVYDTSDPAFRDRMRAQFLALVGRPGEQEALAFWEQAADYDGWDDGGFTLDDFRK